MSLSVLVASHHMIGWCMYLELWKCMQLYNKIIFYSSLPFLLFCMCFVWFSLFAMIINLLMWTDVRTLCGRQVMEISLLSFGLDSAVQVSFRVVAHVFVCLLGNYFEYCWSLYSVLYWHRGVPRYPLLVPWIFVRSSLYTPRLVSYIIHCDISFN